MQWQIPQTLGLLTAKAEAGTIRKLYAESIERNIVHGSNSPENAIKEIGHFFREEDLV
jgi:nucleoside-diphosphate kinase